jgi:hypothetical protein
MNATISDSDPKSYDRVLWGFVNGKPVYMPYGTRAIVVTIGKETAR